MKCAQCQTDLAPDQPVCPECGKRPKAKRKRRSETEGESLTPEAQALLTRITQQYYRVLWGLIPGAGLLLGPWVCWVTQRLLGDPQAKPWLTYLRAIFRLAVVITVSQWLGLGLILLSWNWGTLFP